MWKNCRPLLLLILLPSRIFLGFAGQVGNEQTIINPSLLNNCTNSYIEANNIADGNVDILPYDSASNNMFSKIQKLNASTWELYFFDAVSLDSSAVTLSFFRDGGRLKTQILAIWPDGRTFVTEVYAKESRIQNCDGKHMAASWQGENDGTSFEISHDLREAIVKVDLPTIRGTIFFSSESPAWTKDVETNEERDILHLLAPTIHWLQSIPRASVQVELTIDGRDLAFAGLGGLGPFLDAIFMDDAYG